MKRGLVVLDEAETSRRALGERVERLQGVLEERGVGAAFVYGDVYRSGDITYLSNICIYWNEAVLAVPAKGSPALLTKLSKRVQTWMRASSSLDDLRSGPNLAKLCAEWLEGAGATGPVGLVEGGWWPGTLAAALGAELTGRELVDLGGAVRAERERPEAGEVALLRAGAELSARSVAETLDGLASNDDRAGRAELISRSGGVEDVVVASHPAGPEGDVVEVVGEYRGYWTAAARVIARQQASWSEAMVAGYRAAGGALRHGVTTDGVRAAAAGWLAGAGVPWALEVLHHVDVETGGGYRLPGKGDAPFEAGAVAALRLRLELPDGSSAVASDTFLIGPTGAERLTAALPEAAVVAGS